MSAASGALHDRARLEAALPAGLKQRPQWVGWRYERRRTSSSGARGAHYTKPPVSPITGRYASVREPASWSGFGTALEFAVARGLSGVGFVLTEWDPYVGVDLDDCIEEGVIHPLARRIVDRFASYTEISPSGRGLKVLARGGLHHPEGTLLRSKRLTPFPVEVYERGRYFALTGVALPGYPRELAETNGHATELTGWLYRATSRARAAQRPVGHTRSKSTGATPPIPGVEEVIERALAGRSAAKFRRLYLDGDITGYRSRSEADLALLALLGRFAEGDPALVEDAFSSSALSREKWRERSDYRNRSIQKALRL